VRPVKGTVSLGLAVLVLAPSVMLTAAQGRGDKTIDVRGMARTAPTTFEGLFAAYVKATRAGDAEGALRAFQEIRRLRIERNVLNLDEIALALVSQGKGKLDTGNRDGAAELFGSAASLAPNLPDGHMARALAAFKKGPLGFASTARSTIEAVIAPLPTARGRHHAATLFVPVAMLALFAAAAIFSLAIVLRHGPLLRHDIEEALGNRRTGSMALAIHLLMLLLPAAAFQGWGWLFPWWLALLFVYMDLWEKLIAVLLVASSLFAVPAMNLLEQRTEMARNRLFWASVSSVEGSPDPRSAVLLEQASRRDPADRDLSYLFAAQLRKGGRYDDAAAVYRELLKSNPDDPVATNNLANIEFARGEYPAAQVRYKEGALKAGDSDLKALFFYNQSLAHLQRFEMQPADEALSQARRLSGGLVSGFDDLWKYDKGDYAVVDLGLSVPDLERKFEGVAEGSGHKNVYQGGTKRAASELLLPGLTSRFAGFLAVAALVVAGVSFWRGRRMFTMRCLKCGTPFCRRCHLGAAVAGLCSQCYHLFVVRDGVSGPARNRKLLEVQAEEDRQGKAFRVLSLLLPGAAQVYRGAPFLGLLLSFLWALLIVTALFAGRWLPVTEASGALSSGPWGLVLAGLLLAGVYVVANRMKPETEVLVPVRRQGVNRSRGRN
jgi:tetratricopeptide (TPR) repeat protein